MPARMRVLFFTAVAVAAILPLTEAVKLESASANYEQDLMDFLNLSEVELQALEPTIGSPKQSPAAPQNPPAAASQEQPVDPKNAPAKPGVKPPNGDIADMSKEINKILEEKKAERAKPPCEQAREKIAAIQSEKDLMASLDQRICEGEKVKKELSQEQCQLKQDVADTKLAACENAMNEEFLLKTQDTLGKALVNKVNSDEEKKTVAEVREIERKAEEKVAKEMEAKESVVVSQMQQQLKKLTDEVEQLRADGAKKKIAAEIAFQIAEMEQKYQLEKAKREAAENKKAAEEEKKKEVEKEMDAKRKMKALEEATKKEIAAKHEEAEHNDKKAKEEISDAKTKADGDLQQVNLEANKKLLQAEASGKAAVATHLAQPTKTAAPAAEPAVTAAAAAAKPAITAQTATASKLLSIH